MEEQLPYRAEYAKSSRALCKGCKSNIGQGTLRLAVMVQSAFHDGKQPNWFHSSCFFKKQRPQTVTDIAYFINLKYEDQQMLKEKIDSSTAIVAPEATGKSKSKSKKRANTSDAIKDFGVEYAKSGRAECRGCQQKILRDEIRIKKVVFDTEVGMKYGGQPLWHHVDCFEQVRDDLLYFESGDQLPGFKQLKKEDQVIVQNTIKAKTDAPAIKKVKKEDIDEVDIAKDVEKEKTIIKQNADMYKYKKKLGDLTKQELIAILKENDQYIPIGMSLLIDAVADILTFGAFQRCKSCQNASFIISNNTYVCNGNLDEWVKCMKTMQDPPRKKTVISSEIRSKYSFLNKYKSKVINRVFPHFIPSGAGFINVKNEDGESNSGPKVQREKPKLYNMEFVVIGDTNIDKDELKALITKLGGHLKTKLHSGVTAIISNPDEIEKMNKRMSEVKQLGIHVITDNFFAKVQNDPNPVKLLDAFCICDWATDPISRIPKEEERNPKKSIYTKSSKSSKVTLKLKGGGAVDPDSKLEDIAHIFEQNGLKYNAILTLTDLQAGKNSYYKLQLLEADKGNKYWLFRAWGRIGTTIGGTKVDNFATLNEAKQEFKRLFVEKSGSEFGEQYIKLPGYYQPVDIDYSDTTNKFDIKSDIPSKLDAPIQDLIKLLFDVDLMKKVMLEFELDTEKMPLGKLSKTQIEKALITLNDLSKMIAKGSSQHEFIGASNRFYTLIPHDFGVDQPPLLDTNEIIKLKIEMLESLMEIELAYNMLNDSNINEKINPMDAHYEQLKTSMEVLDSGTEEFKILQQYVQNTHAETHNMYDLEIEQIFKISRSGEDKRFKPFKKLHNRKLLWHGSRLTNFVGILSHGLKIAPPEAPVTGYMFGKGIYFADMVSKSANYCFTSKANNTGLLMLCEVALGDMVEYTAANYVTKLPKNKHSVKGIGSTAPNPIGSIKREDGVEIPCGNPIKDTKSNTSLLYNEYIVYDVAQVKAQYLFKLKFNYKY